MKIVLRLLISALTGFAFFFFAIWISAALMPFDEKLWISFVIAVVCACGAGWTVWSTIGARGGAMISSIVTGALVVGAIGFSAGFFGPMILTPHSNQGPLLGIFITGPAGVLVGAIGGYFYGLRKRSRTADSSSIKPSQS